jgi:deferrochelatase/peroxidase EfeB
MGAVAAQAAAGTKKTGAEAKNEGSSQPHTSGATYPFWGHVQAGIETPQQGHTYFVALDLTTKNREDVIQLMKDWTAASAKLTQGQAVELRKRTPPAKAAQNSNPQGSPAPSGENDDSYIESQSTADSGEASSLPPSRLTLTFGFGPGLFASKDGTDRYGLKKFRPEAMVDLPIFHGDELVEEKSGGDLSIQACADDPQVAFHAIRTLARFADGIAQIRWAQSGFVSGANGSETPRNLMGFKDGTQQPQPSERAKFVWIDGSNGDWQKGASYLVVRKIRIALEHWDRSDVDFQEQVIGRQKKSGAPLGQKHERETLNLKATDKDGNAVIPDNAHVRLASIEANGGSQILRRGYSYNDGVNFTAERWPPWRQGMEYDAGLFFVAYQSDLRTGFIKIYQNMAKLDALNQFVTHVGSGVFICPPGVQKGEYLGQKLFEKV